MDTEKFDNQSLKDKTTLLFSSIKNNLFNNSKEEDIKNENHSNLKQPNIIEDITSTETIKDEEQVLIDVILSESEKTSFLNSILQNSSDNLTSLKESLSQTFDDTVFKINIVKDKSIVLSHSAGKSLIEFSKNINERFTELELKKLLLNNLTKINLIFIISILNNFKSKYEKKSKEFIALAALIGLLTLLNTSINNPENTLKILDNNELEFKDFFKEITLKSVIETTEPFLIMIPNGNYILLILKLFI